MTQDGNNAENLVDRYMEQLFILIADPIYAHVRRFQSKTKSTPQVFESHFTNYTTPKDLWTFSSAVLFTTTTVIPVG